MVLLTGLALTLLATSSPPSADAWTEAADAAKGRQVVSLEVRGLDPELAEPLQAGLALSGRRRWFRTARASFYPRTLREDLERVGLFLARHGYPAADVRADILLAADPSEVRLILHIEPGQRVHLGEIRTPGLPPDFPLRSLPVRSGDVFLDENVQLAVESLTTELQAGGYAFARVEVKTLRRDATTVDIELLSTPGPRYRVDEVRIDGIAADLIPLARSCVPVRTGDVHSPAKVREAELNLRRTGLFRQVLLKPEPTGNETLRIRCHLAERRPQTLEAGVGYFSDEQLRLEAGWEHRNLLSGGRGGRLAGQFSRYLQSVQAELHWPRLGGTRTRGHAGVTFRRESEEAYEVRDVRIGFTARRDLSETLKAAAGIAISHIDVDARTQDPEILDAPRGIVTSVPVEFVRDTSDHPLYPTRGTLTRLGGETTPPGLGSVTHYARGEIQHSIYKAVSAQTVIAVRTTFGLAHPFAKSESVLPSKRFFAGGSRSVRGFGRHRLGPRDEDGNPIGGELKLEMSLEARFPIWGRLEGAAFLDGGQVWSRPERARPGDLEWAAGPALMARTPVGPVRFDWGILLAPVRGEPRGAFHFSVGHPF